MVRVRLQLVGSTTGGVGGDRLGTGGSRGRRGTSRLGNTVLDESKQ
jgi:hypothetical protein